MPRIPLYSILHLQSSPQFVTPLPSPLFPSSDVAVFWLCCPLSIVMFASAYFTLSFLPNTIPPPSHLRRTNSPSPYYLSTRRGPNNGSSSRLAPIPHAAADWRALLLCPSSPRSGSATSKTPAATSTASTMRPPSPRPPPTRPPATQTPRRALGSSSATSTTWACSPGSPSSPRRPSTSSGRYSMRLRKRIGLM